MTDPNTKAATHAATTQAMRLALSLFFNGAPLRVIRINA